MQINAAPSKSDYLMAKRYGFNRMEVIKAYKEKRSKVDIEKINKLVEKKLLGNDFDRAELFEDALYNMINRISAVLANEGHHRLAFDIVSEYKSLYQSALTKQLLGLDEIGDHPPLSEWLDSVHERIHDAVGSFICEYFRFHDIFILNHSIPVVFKPANYDLKDYKDHFAGHLIWGWYFEHHGFAGVVTYWIIEGACIAGSYGLGIITFVCSPIASFGEYIIDKHVAPPIAEAVWQRSQENN